MKQHKYGQHYTPKETTLRYSNILIEKYKKGFTIVDPFVGEGNLLIDFLSFFKKEEAIQIIKNKRIKGFDIDKETLNRLKNRFMKEFNIEECYLDKIFFENNSLLKNKCLENDFILTNPPYLAKNTCKRKFPDDFELNFKNNNFSDYYEIALDLYSKNEGVWIIPSNFLSSNGMRKIRAKLIKDFNIMNVNLYQIPIFEDTDISVISFVLLKREKLEPIQDIIQTNFISKENEVLKNIDIEKNGDICKKWKELSNCTNKYIKQGFLRENLEKGNLKVKVLNEDYKEEYIYISSNQKKYFENNVLFLRTTDTGTKKGLIGLYTLSELFGETDAITLLTKISSRLYVPIFFNDSIEKKEQLKIKEEFNELLNSYRKDYNSIFLTNFKNATNIIQRKRISFKEVYGLIEHIKMRQQ